MKRLTLALALASAFGLGLTSNASAQGSLDVRATVSFNSVSPGRLFRTVAEMAGVEATVDPQLQRPFSITLEDVTVRTLLDAICDSIGCRWRINGNTLVVEALPPDPSRRKTWLRPNGAVMPAGSQFTNTSVGNVFDAIGRTVGEGCTYQVDAVNAGQLVTVDLSSQDELRAIAKVVRAAGLTPGSPYAIVIRRPGQKPTVIQTVVSQSVASSQPRGGSRGLSSGPQSPSAPADFSGTWVPDDAPRVQALFEVGLGPYPGRGMTISQDARIVMIFMSFEMGRERSVVQRFMVYNLNGADSVNVSPTWPISGMEVDRVVWDGDRLVLTRRIGDRERREVYSINDGVLTVVTDKGTFTFRRAGT
jgi:hypothetical protein